MKRFLNWLTGNKSLRKAPKRPDLTQSGAHLRQTGSHLKQSGQHASPSRALPKRQPEYVELDPHLEGRIEDGGPGKNVLIRNKYIREDTGTHETLKILDESVLDTEEEAGIDPYNTGQFDRSKNWDKRTK